MGISFGHGHPKSREDGIGIIRAAVDAGITSSTPPRFTGHSLEFEGYEASQTISISRNERGVAAAVVDADIFRPPCVPSLECPIAGRRYRHT